jgi:hypothetical protein
MSVTQRRHRNQQCSSPRNYECEKEVSTDRILAKE